MLPNQKKRSAGLLALVLAAVALGQLATPRTAQAFSQSSPITPLGHEWITVASALELLNVPKPTLAQLAKDKGKSFAAAVGDWVKQHILHSQAVSKQKALEQPANIKTLTPDLRARLIAASPQDQWPRTGFRSYSAGYYNVWSAVMGQRWVDLGGFEVALSEKCWDAVTQMGDAAQPDHFLRRRNDVGPQGAVAAIEKARANFKQYFIEAVLADPKDQEVITFRSGNGGLEADTFHARKAYFLFGRAAHLFQDSFSTEHGLRNPNDQYRTIIDIKSYVCTLGSVGHTHAKPDSGSHGDVIWFHDLLNIQFGHDFANDNVKPYALAAIWGMQELWSAFLRARYHDHEPGKAAAKFADYIIKKWMSYDPAKVGRLAAGFSPADQAACDKAVGMPAVATTERDRCLKLLAPLGPDRDAHLGIPYNWKWASGSEKQ
jgi:hypothetical protein